ncbi:Branched-chain-amino-acid aminotransferase [Lacunisphaera limnophila]|uniref:Branched-chain-amino-acid aminotransferase n=2 Tax=Lacunisphaera limnophila TaxID=1838286 RepID=A0A1D8AXM6_9BACT|nr:Branched-chain-amino-acid aminotransferase [Lacunisphaera limnophila]
MGGGLPSDARTMVVYFDGNYVDANDAKVSVFDHGLLYGDGIFEGIRIYGGNVFRLDEHLARLELSARALMLAIPQSRAELAAAVCETCRRNNLQDGYIRLVVTRGVGDLGLAPWSCANPTTFIIASKISLYPQEFYDNGLSIVTVPTRRIAPDALPPTIKSLNYLNNILAKIEAKQAGALEAIMLNAQGHIAECTADNVFIVHQGEIITPASSSGALKGITRGTIFDVARDIGVPIREADLTRYDVWCSDECFLTGTGAEVIPVVKLDGRVIGSGKPGPITARVLAGFRQRVLVEGTRI